MSDGCPDPGGLAGCFFPGMAEHARNLCLNKMSIQKILLPLVAALMLPLSVGMAADEAPSVKGELDALVAEISGKIAAGVRTEEALADDIKRFDELYAKYASEKSEDVARVLMMKALLYVEVFRDTDAAMPIFEKIVEEQPESEAAAKVRPFVEKMRARKALAVGKAFPDFQVKDLDGNDLSLADYAGKVVLIDCWATWCGPCVAELPHVLETYEKYHDKGFEIIGISLDTDRDKLAGFIEQRGMTWRQYFDGKGWENELADKYGISSIPATFLIDGEGTIIGTDLRGEALTEAVAAALSK